MSSTTQNSSDAGNTKMLGSSVTVLILGDSKGQVLMPSPKCMIKESIRLVRPNPTRFFGLKQILGTKFGLSRFRFAS